MIRLSSIKRGCVLCVWGLWTLPLQIMVAYQCHTNVSKCLVFLYYFPMFLSYLSPFHHAASGADLPHFPTLSFTRAQQEPTVPATSLVSCLPTCDNNAFLSIFIYAVPQAMQLLFFILFPLWSPVHPFLETFAKLSQITISSYFFQFL